MERKIIAGAMLCMMLFAMSSFAMAQPPEPVRNGLLGGEKPSNKARFRVNETNEFKPLQLIENNETNMSKTAKQKLTQVANNFRERNRNRVNCTGNCYLEAENITENRTEISENKPVRILGIPATARKSFEVNDEGEILEQRRNFAQTMRDWGLARGAVGQ